MNKFVLIVLLSISTFVTHATHVTKNEKHYTDRLRILTGIANDWQSALECGEADKAAELAAQYNKICEKDNNKRKQPAACCVIL